MGESVGKWASGAGVANTDNRLRSFSSLFDHFLSDFLCLSQEYWRFSKRLCLPFLFSLLANLSMALMMTSMLVSPKFMSTALAFTLNSNHINLTAYGIRLLGVSLGSHSPHSQNTVHYPLPCSAHSCLRQVKASHSSYPKLLLLHTRPHTLPTASSFLCVPCLTW